MTGSRAPTTGPEAIAERLRSWHGLGYLSEDAPPCCRRALDFVFELVEAGRLSSPEADALLVGIWPMRRVDKASSPNLRQRWEPLFRLAETTTTTSEQPAS